MKDNVFILRWDPHKCTFSEKDFLEFRNYYFLKELDWRIDDYIKYDVNDTNIFFMISESPICPGIIMKGVLDDVFLKMDTLHKKYSGPFGYYPQAFYSKLHVHYIAEPYNTPFISLDELKKRIPDFDWAKGINGQYLTSEVAKKLLGIWNAFENNNLPYFRGLEFEKEIHIDPKVVERIVNYNICPNLNELLINECERERIINNWIMSGEEPLICSNKQFYIDYMQDKGSGMYLKLYIRPDKILHIKCNQIFNFESNMWRYRDCINEFYIIESSSEFLKVIINGLQIICRKVEFVKFETYSGAEPLRNVYFL